MKKTLEPKRPCSWSN